MLIMEEIIAECGENMYKAGQKKDSKKDVRSSKTHIHNKPHVLIVASKHPRSVQVGDSDGESQGS